jgi:hypothetical protein
VGGVGGLVKLAGRQRLVAETGHIIEVSGENLTGPAVELKLAAGGRGVFILLLRR